MSATPHLLISGTCYVGSRPNLARKHCAGYCHLKKIVWTHPTPGGFRLSVGKKSFVTDRAQIWHACADRYSHFKKNHLTNPTPGWFRGFPIVKNLSRWTAPKFGTHLRMDTLTLKKNLTTPPQGGLGGYLLLKIFRDGPRPHLARMCG